MQLRKFLRKLIVVFIIVGMVACSSNKKISSEQNTKIDDNNIGNNDSRNAPSIGEAYFELQQLQKDNIVYFHLDKYDIRSEFLEILDAHAIFLLKNLSYKVTLEGHADERGTPEYNISLGERRANAVKMYLQSKGVSANQIFIISYGKEKPAVLGHNETAYAQNRRVVLICQE